MKHNVSGGEDGRRSSAWPYVVAGFFVIFGLVGGIVAWAVKTEIAGAVVAPGIVVVETSLKTVQHPTGGIVGDIRVKNGDKVEAGAIVMRLDETVTRATLNSILSQLDELSVREARLKAERDGLERLAHVSSGSPYRDGFAEMLAGEKSLFENRRAVRDGQRAQLRKRIAQLEEEIAGVAAQSAAKLREIALIGEELSGLETLEAKQLVTSTRMVALRREAARLDGELGHLRASGAQAKGRIAEIELQILRIDQELRSEVTAELREIHAKKSELMERKVGAEDQLNRIDIRAPQAGIVHQLSVHTVGGVVAQGDALMHIVPEGDRLVLEARISPADIDQVLGREAALVRFAAFDQRTTPELAGWVRQVSPDLARDPVTGETYYLARIEIPEVELAHLGDKHLVPGMPADVQIRTEMRSALSYLMKPLEDQIARAFKER
jgi:membrane fusion protein, type I secretion system